MASCWSAELGKRHNGSTRRKRHDMSSASRRLRSHGLQWKKKNWKCSSISLRWECWLLRLLLLRGRRSGSSRKNARKFPKTFFFRGLSLCRRQHSCCAQKISNNDGCSRRTKWTTIARWRVNSCCSWCHWCEQWTPKLWWTKQAISIFSFRSDGPTCLD